MNCSFHGSGETSAGHNPDLREFLWDEKREGALLGGEGQALLCL